MKKGYKIFLTTLVVAFCLVVFIISAWVVLLYQSYEQDDFELGVNFSNAYAEYLGLNWHKTYLNILDDLQVENIRLAAPWNEIEPEKDRWDFSALDWQIEQAEKRNIDVILVIGRRTPHWPECHDPKWIGTLPEEVVRDRQLKMMKKIIERYKEKQSIQLWQVENEPLLNVFGICPPSDLNWLRKEVAFVKTLDERPVLVTDSGELSLWIAAANAGDLFGTTMYRVIHSPFLGYAYYQLPPIFYRAKAALAGKSMDEVIIAELQAEPWAPKGVWDTSLDEQAYSMDAERLSAHVNYARRTGFTSAYLWGAEWWWWLKEKQDDEAMWETAKQLLVK
jgi:hypothetical protein